MVRYGVDPVLRTHSGVSVVADDERAGSAVASCYVLGEHAVVFADPAVAELVGAFRPDGLPAEVLEDWQRFGADVGAEVLGVGIVRTLVAEPVRVEGIAVIDREDPMDVERLRVMLAGCSEDDIDEAEIDLDELDPIIRCSETEPGGVLTAYASARPSENLAGRWDIGTLTHPAHRRRGLGLRALQRLTWDLVAGGHEPVYRHNADNLASAALAERGGYAIASPLVAIRLSVD